MFIRKEDYPVMPACMRRSERLGNNHIPVTTPYPILTFAGMTGLLNAFIAEWTLEKDRRLIGIFVLYQVSSPAEDLAATLTTFGIF